jgi:hypothetical protein
MQAICHRRGRFSAKKWNKRGGYRPIPDRDCPVQDTIVTPLEDKRYAAKKEMLVLADLNMD